MKTNNAIHAKAPKTLTDEQLPRASAAGGGMTQIDPPTLQLDSGSVDSSVDSSVDELQGLIVLL